MKAYGTGKALWEMKAEKEVKDLTVRGLNPCISWIMPNTPVYEIQKLGR